MRLVRLEQSNNLVALQEWNDFVKDCGRCVKYEVYFKKVCLSLETAGEDHVARLQFESYLNMKARVSCSIWMDEDAMDALYDMDM